MMFECKKERKKERKKEEESRKKKIARTGNKLAILGTSTKRRHILMWGEMTASSWP